MVDKHAAFSFFIPCRILDNTDNDKFPEDDIQRVCEESVHHARGIACLLYRIRIAAVALFANDDSHLWAISRV